MKALRLLQEMTEPVLVDVDEPTPGPGQVVIRVGGSGACQSDLHLLHAPASALPGLLPFTLGHETAGWIHALGEGVTGWEIGQAVAVMGAWGCGQCRLCRAGDEQYCENMAAAPYGGATAGLGVDGGMAEYLLVPNARPLIALPEGMTPAMAAPLTDAGMTPYHAIRRSQHKLVPGSTTVVIGVGGLGHLAIQILKATSATQIIAVDSRPEALEHASTVGADLTVVSGDGAADAIREFTGGHGAEVVVDFVGIDATMSLAASIVRPLGDLTVVGIGGGSLPVSFGTVPLGVSVQMQSGGTRSEVLEVLALAAQGKIVPEITTYPLDQALEVYELLKAGKIRGRAVIVPNEN